jgi:hypothetical protein
MSKLFSSLAVAALVPLAVATAVFALMVCNGPAEAYAASRLLYSEGTIAAQFDGDWNMVAVTTSGHCGTIPIGLEISRGRIYSTGGSFAAHSIQLAGRVSASGQVRMSAVAGPRQAHGAGRFARFRGSGTWAGTGPSGVCSGIWTATRS